MPDELKVKDRSEGIGNLSFTLPYTSNGFNNYTPKYTQTSTTDQMSNRIMKSGVLKVNFN